MELTEDQKNFIRTNQPLMKDLIELTRAVFRDDSLDGRTQEGRAVKAFLVDNNLGYSTTKREKAKDVKLDREQKRFIEQYSSEGMNSFEIASLIFGDVEVKKLGMEQRAVLEYLDSHAPDLINASEDAIEEYSPPRTVQRAIKKINKYDAQNLSEDKLTKMLDESIKKLITYLSSPRFISTINNYSSQSDRDLFEAEFIRTTWEKSDLTNDEINLYINVCIEYINLKNINKHIEKLNRMFDDLEEENEMTVRLAEILKAKSTEYDQCEKRQRALISVLNGDRAKRIANRIEKNASILSLVQAFQNEEDRRFMVEIAERQKLLVSEEADRIESVESWKARVLGIDKRDIV